MVFEDDIQGEREVIGGFVEEAAPTNHVEPILSRSLLDRYRSRCANCGDVERLKGRWVVPLEAGGHNTEDNVVLLCRTCDMAADMVSRGDPEPRRAINIWISDEMNDKLKNGLSTKNGFASMGAMVRYLISVYIQDPERFDDLESYQDSRTADVKINIWVDRDRYEVFKVLVDKRGKTVTETLKSLIRMYECGVESLMRNKK